MVSDLDIYRAANICTTLQQNREGAMRLLMLVMIAVACAGCARSTGIMPAGPNTYSLKEQIAPIAGGGMEAQRQALQEANAYCKSQGREMLPVQSGSGDYRGIYGETSYNVTFRCLLPTDPEFRR